jgi:hypothetical protein
MAYYNADAKKVYSYDLLTGKESLIFSGPVEALRVFEGKLYFVTSSEVFTTDLKGGGRQVLAKGKTDLIDEVPEGLHLTAGGKKVFVER